MAKSPLTVQAGFPGQMGLLARQMNDGFGGGLLAQRNNLNAIYDPVQMSQMPRLGGDPTKDTTTDGAMEIDPGMERWRRLLSFMPEADANARLAELQDGFRRAGYLK